MNVFTALILDFKLSTSDCSASFAAISALDAAMTAFNSSMAAFAVSLVAYTELSPAFTGYIWKSPTLKHGPPPTTRLFSVVLTENLT